MPAIDVQVRQYQDEIEERTAFINSVIESSNGGDLDTTQMRLITDATERVRSLQSMVSPLSESLRVARDSKIRYAELQSQVAKGPNSPVEYRSAAVYIADRYLAGLGDEGANQRLDLYHRAAAHQTTADNPGLLPESIVGPLVNFVDEARPIVGTVGPTDLGTGSWAYARVTVHTQVGVQAGEKTELASRKMTITKTPITAPTYGGYVNVSRQDISRTTPGILDMVINDLAGQYAIATETAAALAMTTAAQTGPVIPATPTGANIATAIWGAAGSVYAATKGQGRTVIAVSPDQLGIIGPVFPGINPTNAFSSGFNAGDINSGVNGSISGLTVVMSAGLATDTILVFSTAAVRMFEARYGALQVVEPSVWGVQVGYAGDFQTVVVEPTGIVRVTTA